MNSEVSEQVDDGGLDKVYLVCLQLLFVTQLLSTQGESLRISCGDDDVGWSWILNAVFLYCSSPQKREYATVKENLVYKTTRCGSQVLRPCPLWEVSKMNSLLIFNTHSLFSQECRSDHLLKATQCWDLVKM